MTADEIMNLADDFATRLKELCGLFSNDHPAASMRQREFIRDFAPKAQPKVEPVQEPVPPLGSKRKAAQMALEWFDWLNAPDGPISTPHTAKDVQNALRKELSE